MADQREAGVPKGLQSKGNVAFMKEFKKVSRMAKVLQGQKLVKEQELGEIDQLLETVMQGMEGMLQEAPEIEPRQHGQEEVVL